MIHILLTGIGGFILIMAVLRQLVNCDNSLREHGWLAPVWDYQKKAAASHAAAKAERVAIANNFWAAFAFKPKA